MDYWAQAFCLGCTLFSLFWLIRTEAFLEVPLFFMFLVFSVPSALIWLCSWFSAWPYFFPIWAGWLALASAEAARRASQNLYHEEQVNARRMSYWVGIACAAAVLYCHPGYPDFPGWSYLSAMMAIGFCVGCAVTATAYWVRFKSASVRPYVAHGAMLAFYSSIIIGAAISRDEWHDVMGMACIGRGLLVVTSTLCLTRRIGVSALA